MQKWETKQAFWCGAQRGYWQLPKLGPNQVESSWGQTSVMK